VGNGGCPHGRGFGSSAHREWTIYYLFAVSKPLSDGINVGDTVILLAGSLICLVIAIIAFDRRDILA
jgi:hypothetical protein